MNAFQRLIGRKQTSSREIAKNRLQLVLVQDRVNLPAGKMDQLKDELIQVISKYVEIDQDGIEISLTGNGRQHRLTANIPVVRARRK
ncbi:cell division topological specificity factor MinE [Chloroflexota bacterium]